MLPRVLVYLEAYGLEAHQRCCRCLAGTRHLPRRAEGISTGLATNWRREGNVRPFH